MIRPQSALLLSAVLVACGGDPNPRPPLTSADASGMITDPGRFDASLPDVQLPFDVRLPDGAAIPDGFFDDLFLLPDRPAPDVQAPADGPRSAYTCPTPRRIRRLAQPSTVTNLGPLGTMTSYQAPASVANDTSSALYVARDAVGWSIRRVNPVRGTDEIVLRTEGQVTHLSVYRDRIFFRPVGDASSIESVDPSGAGRRVEFRNVAILDGPYEETRPFGSEAGTFAFGVRTMDGVRGDRFLLLRRNPDGTESVIFSRRRGTAVFMPRITSIRGSAVIATTISDASTELGLLFVPLDRAAIADPTAAQNDVGLRFVPYTRMFGPPSGPGGDACVGSCVALTASSESIFCVRQSGCAPDLAPTLRAFRVPFSNDTTYLEQRYATVFDLAGMVGARGPAQVGRIVATGRIPGVYVLMNLPAPGPGRARHDLLVVGESTLNITVGACDLPAVMGFAPHVLSLNAANEPDELWGIWNYEW